MALYPGAAEALVKETFDVRHWTYLYKIAVSVIHTRNWFYGSLLISTVLAGSAFLVKAYPTTEEGKQIKKIISTSLIASAVLGIMVAGYKAINLYDLVQLIQIPPK
jgi:hypothetical protein